MRNIAPLLEYFVEFQASENEEKQNLVKELKNRGRWPAKDLFGFFAPDEEEVKTYKSGKNAGKTYRSRHWDHRLFTQPGDRELLTRHEIQKNPPDLRVTNYSMLAYMLLRPIERSIFRKTCDWLASNPSNQFLLILDEAHMCARERRRRRQTAFSHWVPMLDAMRVDDRSSHCSQRGFICSFEGFHLSTAA